LAPGNPRGTPANLRRGNPGNKGGRPSNQIREKSIKGHLQLLNIILKKAKNKELRDAEIIRLIDVLGKFGVGTKTEITVENAHFAALVVEIALEFIPEENWPEFQERVKILLGGGDA